MVYGLTSSVVEAYTTANRGLDQVLKLTMAAPGMSFRIEACVTFTMGCAYIVTVSIVLMLLVIWGMDLATVLRFAPFQA